MDPRTLLIWGLAVWLVTTQECSAAAYKGRYYSPDEVSGSSPPQGHVAKQQDPNSGSIESDKSLRTEELQKVTKADSLTPNENITKERSPVKATGNPSKPDNVADNPIEHPTNDAKSNLEYVSGASITESVEDGSEEEDQNGIVRGKYSYVEEDGVPALIEYEAIPGMKFVIKTYLKGSKLLPVPQIIESPESGRVLTFGNSNENQGEKMNYPRTDDLTDAPKLNLNNLKTTSTVLLEKDPEYDHASVIGKHNSKTLIRKVRTIDQEDSESELNLTNESEIKTENAENYDTQVGKSESPVDASYKFGFSADGQTRNEEADAKGNVQGSYSYIGDDGVWTKVEYEAGSGKGFIVKRIVQEDRRRSLEDKANSPDIMNPDQPSVKIYSKDEDFSTSSADQEVKSQNHKIESQYKKDPTAISEEQTYKGEEENKGKINMNNDGSYSFSYETPEQRREESMDSTGHIKSRFSFIAQGGKKIQQPQNEAILPKGFSSQEFDHTMINPFKTPKFSATPTLTNLNTNNLKMNSDGSYSFSYVTPNQFRAEVAHMNEHNSGFTKDKEITQQNEDSSTAKDLSGSQNPQDHIANVDNTSPFKKDGSYSYSYETSDQMRKEASDIDGNVQGQYSYLADDGIRRTVHYKAGPESGFTAEGSHLPSMENLSQKSGASNAVETETTFTSPGTTYLSEPGTSSVGIMSSVNDESGKKQTDSNTENVYEEGFDSPQRAEASLKSYPHIVSMVGFPQQGVENSPQVYLDLSGIRRAVAVKDNEKVHKHKKIIKKRPLESITPSSAISPHDGSYSFTYNTKDQIRSESVDTKGNVYSNYQYKTNDNGRTVVVFIRKRIKDGANENLREARNIFEKHAKRNIPLDYINEDISDHHNNYYPPARRNRVNRKRHIQRLSEPRNTPADHVKQFVLPEPQDSQVISDVITPSEGSNEFKNKLKSQLNNHRIAKSVIKPFRGTVRFQR